MDYVWILVKYLVILLPILIFSFETYLPTTNRYFEKLAVAILVIFSAMRYGVGRDYYSYKITYEDSIPSGVDVFSSEPVSSFLFQLFVSANVPYNIFLGFLSFAYIFVFYKYVLGVIEKEYRLIGFVIFLIVENNFFGSLGVVRQYISVTFFILFISFFYQNKIKSWILGLMAVLSHNSSLLLMALFFKGFKFSRNSLYWLIFSAFLLFLFPQFIGFVAEKILTFLNLPFPAKYFTYSSPSLVKLVFYSFVLLQLLFLIKLLNSDEERWRGYHCLCIVGCLFSLLTMTGLEFLGRYLAYFYVFLPISIYRVIKIGLLNKFVVLLFYFIIFSSFQVKTFYEPVSYSHYKTQYRLLPFFSNDDISRDLSIYLFEEREFYFESNSN